MLTRNWYKGVATLATSMYASVIGADGGTRIRDYMHFRFEGAKNTSSSHCSTGTILTSMTGAYGGVVFGTGTTPPTVDDLDISGDVITKLSANVTYKQSTDNNELTTTYMLTNTDTVDVTIGEIVACMGSGNTGYKRIVIDRTVLDTPVTIPAGGIGQVTYTIRMNYPTA